jgi:hypothetical protein
LAAEIVERTVPVEGSTMVTLVELGWSSGLGQKEDTYLSGDAHAKYRPHGE